MTTTHKLTNGEGNKIFKISGDVATVLHVPAYGEVEAETMTIDQARKCYAFGKQVGWVAGFTRLQAFKRITTNKQLGEYLDNSFDFENDDNAPEAALALEEEFSAAGYLEVEA